MSGSFSRLTVVPEQQVRPKRVLASAAQGPPPLSASTPQREMGIGAAASRLASGAWLAVVSLPQPSTSAAATTGASRT